MEHAEELQKAPFRRQWPRLLRLLHATPPNARIAFSVLLPEEQVPVLRSTEEPLTDSFLENLAANFRIHHWSLLRARFRHRRRLTEGIVEARGEWHPPKKWQPGPIRSRPLSEWTAEEANRRNLPLSTQELLVLQEKAGARPAVIANYLEVLALLKEDGRQTLVRALEELPDTGELSIYRLLDGILQGKREVRTRLLQQVRRSQAYAPSVFRALQQVVLELLLVSVSTEPPLPEWRTRLLRPLASRLQKEDYARLLRALHHAEVRTKLTDDDPYGVLEEVLIEMEGVLGGRRGKP